MNLRTASDDVLFEACKLVVGAATAQKIVRLRSESPDISVNELLSTIEVSDENARKLLTAISTSSISQAMWLKATHRKSENESYWFAVREGFMTGGADASVYRYQAFGW